MDRARRRAIADADRGRATRALPAAGHHAITIGLAEKKFADVVRMKRAGLCSWRACAASTGEQAHGVRVRRDHDGAIRKHLPNAEVRPTRAIGQRQAVDVNAGVIRVALIETRVDLARVFAQTRRPRLAAFGSVRDADKPIGRALRHVRAGQPRAWRIALSANIAPRSAWVRHAERWVRAPEQTHRKHNRPSHASEHAHCGPDVQGCARVQGVA